jgi:S1-C subfamily serine protease
MNSIKGKILAVVAVLIIAAAAFSVGSGAFSATKTVAADQSLYSETLVSQIYEDVSPAVVEIDVSQQSTTGYFGRYTQEGEGSGFLIDSNKGYILTNNHVIEGATDITVKLSTGDTLDAEVVGSDANIDLALIKVDASKVNDITALSLGDSSAVKPGQMAIAIGNPYGYQNSITVGIISGINRTISSSTYYNMLQTDAAINPGNSGGPLLDSNGVVIGINTAIESTSTGAQGIGFAITSNTAEKALDNLKDGKQIERPWIGIAGRAINSALAKSLDLPVEKGIYIASVVSDSPADKAGLIGASAGKNTSTDTLGDIITEVDGKSVSSVQDLSAYINTLEVGDSITLTIVRDGANKKIDLTLGAKPADTSTSVTPRQMPQMPNFPGFGFRGNSGTTD